VLEFAKAHGFKPRVLLVHDGNGQVKRLGNHVSDSVPLHGRLGTGLRSSIGRASVRPSGEDVIVAMRSCYRSSSTCRSLPRFRAW